MFILQIQRAKATKRIGYLNPMPRSISSCKGENRLLSIEIDYLTLSYAVGYLHYPIDFQ